MSKEVLGAYKNGNTRCIIYTNGTKLKWMPDDEPEYCEYPETIDIDVSNRCTLGCKFCYAEATPNGAIADFNSPLFESLRPYTEIALNGNGVIGTVEFEDFLFKMARQKVICNITLHLHDFINHFYDIQYCIDHKLLWGIGVSVNGEVNENVISYLKAFPNVIIHVIAGVVPWETLVALANHGLKLLILGYKNYGRGEDYLRANPMVERNIKVLADRYSYLTKHFAAVCFDNLALEQLDIKGKISEEDWQKFYLGRDGQHSFFIDAVKMEYAKSSISLRKKIDILDVNELFRSIRDENDS